jgi:hypothetical protein
MNINAAAQIKNGLVDNWINGSVGSKKSNPTTQQSNNPVAAQPRKLAVAIENVAFTVPIETDDAASLAIRSLAKNFLAQPNVALLAQATDFSENALRLLQ